MDRIRKIRTLIPPAAYKRSYKTSAYAVILGAALGISGVIGASFIYNLGFNKGYNQALAAQEDIKYIAPVVDKARLYEPSYKVVESVDL